MIIMKKTQKQKQKQKKKKKKTLGLLESQCPLWVPWTNHYRTHPLFFKKKVCNYEIAHKHGHFKLGL